MAPVSSYYEQGEQRAPRVEQLFKRIARRYDLVNDVQSFGMHRLWKRRLIELVAAKPGDRIIDLATGTGDLVRMGRERYPGTEWVGLDFTLEMLKCSRIHAPMIQADILRMPLRDGTASAMTMAYGMRNVASRRAAMAEIRRVLRPGGRLVFLDFAKPESALLRAVFFSWLWTVQPLLGAVFFGDPAAYGYILQSLGKYPEVAGITRELEEEGFRSVEAHRLFGGMMSIHVAVT